MEKTCTYCGSAFEGNAKARFCSSSHRVLAHRQQRGQQLTPFLQLNDQTAELAQIKEAYKALELRLQTLTAENEELRAQKTADRATGKTEPSEAPSQQAPVEKAKKTSKTKKNERWISSFASLLNQTPAQRAAQQQETEELMNKLMSDRGRSQ